MLKYIYGLVFAMISSSVNGQAFTNYGNLKLGNGNNLTIQNMALINNGMVDATSVGSNNVAITGNANQSISYLDGTNPITFYNLQFNKTSNNFLSRKNFSVTSNLIMNGGDLILDNCSLNLGSNGIILNENLASNITGINNGFVERQFMATAPLVNFNPGNVGIEITTATNPGSLSVKRLYRPSNITTGRAVQRYYHVSATNNSSLSATVKLFYDDNELNGAIENDLNILTSNDTLAWINIARNANSTTQNFVSQTGVNSFGYFALSSNWSLPLKLLSFNGKIQNGKALLYWEVTSESPQTYYELQRQVNSQSTYHTLSLIRSKNLSTSNYFFMDEHMENGMNHYRLKITEANSDYKFSHVFTLQKEATNRAYIYPNPVLHELYLFIDLSNISIKKVSGIIYDALGNEVHKIGNLQQGVNKVIINSLSKGLYTMVVVNNNFKQTIPFFKQ